MSYLLRVNDKTVKRGFLPGELVVVAKVKNVGQGSTGIANEILGVDKNTTGGNLHLGLSRTVSLGNSNFAKVEIMVDHPYEPGMLNDTYEDVSSWLVGKFVDAVKSITVA